jgi:ABC-type polysaccharide/polyol phosphate transport system ATPase subunit
MTNVIEVSDVTKTYRFGVGRARVREMIPPPFDSGLRRILPDLWARDTFNALDSVSASISTGSAVGVVGHNGAGKTTLLKVISGVTSPTAGRSTTRGRLAALLDVLVGFHPELTGRENAYLLGSMLGIGRRSMFPRIDQAIDFAELDSSLVDTPVKRYSAGMTSRLAFGVISAVEPEVLLVDEVLSVGDANFQKKCIKWLDRYRAGRGTLLFVSHNLGLVRSMADRVIWLADGRVMADAATGEVLPSYARAMEQRNTETRIHMKAQVRKQMESRGLDRWGAGGARIESVHLEDLDAGARKVDIEIRYERSTADRAVFCVGFEDESQREVGAAASPLMALSGSGGSVNCSIRPLPFWPGIYFPVVAIVSQNGQVEDRWKLERALVVTGEADVSLVEEFGPTRIHAEWSNGASN